MCPYCMSSLPSWLLQGEGIGLEDFYSQGVVTCVSPVEVFAMGIKIFDGRKIDLITRSCLSEALDCLVYSGSKVKLAAMCS